MGIDNEVFDRAFDAAEAKLNDSSKEDDITEVNNTEEVDPPLEESEPEEGQAIEEEKLDKEVNNPKKEPSTDKEQISDQENAESGSEEVAQDIAQPIGAPSFWSNDDKAIFAKAPREVQEAFYKYDAQRNEWANRVALEAEKGKHYEKRASEVFEPYELELQAQGIKDPFEAASRLLAWNKIFEKDPYTGISELMRRNGFTPADFENQAQTSTQQEVYDPRYEEVLQKADKVEKEFSEYKQQQQANVINAQVEAFKNSKDSYGQTRSVFVQTYEPQIAQAIEAIKRIQPNMEMNQILSTAYDYVMDDVRKLHGINSYTPQKVTTVNPKLKIAEAKKAKDAASSISGAPSNGVSGGRNKAKSIDEALDRAEEQLGLR